MASSSKKTAIKAKIPAKKAEIEPENHDPVVKVPSENLDFKAEIEKSRAMIQNSDKPAETPRNKGGRPSKAEVAAREAAVREAQAIELANAVPPAGLKENIKMPFALLALQTGFDGFQLSEEEAEALAPTAHVLLLKYAPQVKSEHVALISFSGALFSIGLSKYMAFMAFRQQGAGATNDSVPPPASPPAPATVSTSPIDGFLTQQV